MKDLEQLEKKNLNILNSNKAPAPQNRRKIIGLPSAPGDKKHGINYEDRIKELEAKLFGK